MPAHAASTTPIDGPIGQELLDKVTSNQKAGLVAICWMDAGARSVYDTKKPIKEIADPDTANSGTMTNFTGSRRVFSRASAGHKRKSLVKIGEVTPPKRPPILGPLELGEPIGGLVPPPPIPVTYGAPPPLEAPPPHSSAPPLP